MSNDWSTRSGAFHAVERQRELLALRQEIRMARHIRQPRPIRRRLGTLLIAAGEALYGPSRDTACPECTLAAVSKH